RTVPGTVSRPDSGKIHRVHLARRAQLPRSGRATALCGPHLLRKRCWTSCTTFRVLASGRPGVGPQLALRNGLAVNPYASYPLHGIRTAARTGTRGLMTGAARVALFADTFYEVNGAARACREWFAFAGRRQLPFFCIRWSNQRAFSGDGPVWS